MRMAEYAEADGYEIHHGMTDAPQNRVLLELPDERGEDSASEAGHRVDLSPPPGSRQPPATALPRPETTSRATPPPLPESCQHFPSKRNSPMVLVWRGIEQARRQAAVTELLPVHEAQVLT